jgi:hypothetical protein
MLQPVFGVDHFRRGAATTYLPEAANRPATLKSRLLSGIEMEKPQCQRTGAITDAHQQSPPAAKTHLGQVHHPLDHGLVARAQRTHRRQAGAILIAQRQMKQDILHRADP